VRGTSIFTEQRSLQSGSTANHQQMRTSGAMDTLKRPFCSMTLGTRDALIAACILPFNYTHSVLPRSTTIESCNQTLSMALVNQTLPFRTWRLGGYQPCRPRGGAGKRKDKSPRGSRRRAGSPDKIVLIADR
jgi:hypothetical protein